MNYKICAGEKDVMSLMWNVFASFGYKDAVETEQNVSSNNLFERLIVDKTEKCELIFYGCKTSGAISEMTAMAVEACLMAEIPDLTVEVSCSEEVGDILYLYSMDEYLKISEGDFKIVGKSGNVKVFSGGVSNMGVNCVFDITAISTVCKPVAVPETVVYCEKDSEGIGYEIAYTMRLSGCLVTIYPMADGIDKCEEYATKNNVQSIIRVYSDGKIQIKETGSKEITETDYNTFVGYYDSVDESDEEHHHHDCDCGHCH